MCRWVLGLALVMAVFGPGTAAADDEEDTAALRRMRFAERRGRLVVTTSFSELFDKRTFQRLSSRAPTTVLIRGWVYRDGRLIPIAFTLASFRVEFDLWDEMYTVRFDGPDGKRTMRLRSKVEVLDALTRLRSFPIANLKDVAIGPNYRLGLVVELNPLPSALVAETRRWLSKPAGRDRLDVRSSVFGSFVSIFVNPKLSRADRVIRYQSQPFFRVRQ